MDNQIGLVGRLRKAGATHVFVGGDRDDIAIMSRDAAKLEAGIVFAGAEALRAPPGEIPLAAGTLMVAPPEWADIAEPSTLAALATAGIPPEGYVLPSYAAMQIALAALSAGPIPAGAQPGELFTATYPTAIGPVRFDARGDVSQNPYRVFGFDGSRFTPVESQ